MRVQAPLHNHTMEYTDLINTLLSDYNHSAPPPSHTHHPSRHPFISIVSHVPVSAPVDGHSISHQARVYFQLLAGPSPSITLDLPLVITITKLVESGVESDSGHLGRQAHAGLSLPEVGAVSLLLFVSCFVVVCLFSSCCFPSLLGDICRCFLN